MSGRNSQGLFSEWLAIEIEEAGSQVAALDAINQACGTRYQHNWVSLQRRNQRGLERTPLVVRQYMLRRVLTVRLAGFGVVDPEVVEEWVCALS